MPKSGRCGSKGAPTCNVTSLLVPSTSNPGSCQVANISIPSEPDIPPGTGYPDGLDKETYDAIMNFFVEEEVMFSAVSKSRKVLYLGDHGYKYSNSHHKASTR